MLSVAIPWWLVMAGVPSLLYAISNHIDKHLLEKYFVGELGVLTLLVVSALFSIVAVPFIWVWSPLPLIPDDLTNIFFFALVGLLHLALMFFYLTALNEEDTTTVVIFYSILPVLGFAASNLFLNETLEPMQLVAMAVTIVGVLIVSFEKDGKSGYRFKLKAAILMFSASLCWALGDVVFKLVAIEESLQRALFWENLFLFAAGVIILFFAPKVRGQLRRAIKRNSSNILAINFTSEGLYILANVVSAVPLLMVQVAAVHLVQAFQPVWVFLIALLLWKIGFSNDRFTLAQVVQKAIATSIAVYGMYLLAVHTPT